MKEGKIIELLEKVVALTDYSLYRNGGEIPLSMQMALSDLRTEISEAIEQIRAGNK